LISLLFKNTIVSLFAFLVSFLVCELLTIYLIGHPLKNNEYKRIVLYQKSQNFKNQKNFFTYYPNSTFRTEAFFVLEDENGINPVKEYSYYINTNNIGLVQKLNIKKNDNVTLILGDSFTEGQGANPWFYKLEKELPDKKFVNGGLMGTGPLQWKLLRDFLKRDLNLNYNETIQIIIGPDIVRPIWNFDKERLNCIQKAVCSTGLSDFFGYNFQGKNEKEILDDVIDIFYKNQSQSINLKSRSIKGLFRESAFIYNTYILVNKIFINDDHLIQKNLNSLFETHLNSTNSSLILVSIKPEICGSNDCTKSKTKPKEVIWSSNSKKIIEYAKNLNLELDFCILDPEDYHKHDGHPNEKGYSKIKDCVKRNL